MMRMWTILDAEGMRELLQLLEKTPWGRRWIREFGDIISKLFQEKLLVILAQIQKTISLGNLGLLDCHLRDCFAGLGVILYATPGYASGLQ